MVELCDLEAVELRRRIGAREISPVELLESCIGRIEAVNGAVNAVVAMDLDGAREAARRAEAAVLAGDDLGPLHGLPVGVKDLEETAGLRTTHGSLLFENHVPGRDAASVARLRDAGAVILAKTNTPEFGAGANTRNRVYGTTRNPFDLVLSTAGSSGGSAAALACSMVALATGSDLGGSLRTPASFCGIVGFRPSPGTVPNDTRTAALSPFSVRGPMGRTVADAALLLSAQTARDFRDPFGGAFDPALREPLGPADLGSLRVAVSEDLGLAPASKVVRELFRARVGAFRHLFAAADDRDPEPGPLHEAFEVLRAVEFVAAHKDELETRRDLLGPQVIDNTERGVAYSLPDVARAQAEQSNYYRRFMDMFDEVDLLICPTAAVPPYPHARPHVEEIDGEKMPTYMRWLALAYGLTMATPAVAAVPCGTFADGLAFGIQIAAPNGRDRFVLEAAHALERHFAANPDLARPTPDLDALAAAETARAAS